MSHRPSRGNLIRWNEDGITAAILKHPTQLVMKVDFAEHVVPRGQHRIYAREYAGQEPSIILMHGLPDNLHLYAPGSDRKSVV